MAECLCFKKCRQICRLKVCEECGEISDVEIVSCPATIGCYSKNIFWRKIWNRVRYVITGRPLFADGKFASICGSSAFRPMTPDEIRKMSAGSTRAYFLKWPDNPYWQEKDSKQKLESHQKKPTHSIG